MIKHLDHNEDHTAEQIVALQNLAYRVEAQLIDFDGIPPLHDTVATIRESKETFYGYIMGELLVGLIAYQIAGNVLDICRMAVHPDYFRRGIARALLFYVEEHFGTGQISVSTGANNFPAVQLYTSLGFTKVKEFKIPAGVGIAVFEKVSSVEN